MVLPRLVFVPLALLLGTSSVREREEIVFRVPADTTLERSLKSTYSMQLESMAFTMNGEEVPADAFGEVDIQIEHSEAFVVSDAFEAVADGRPQRLRRTFEELGGKESSSYSSEGEDASDDSNYESELEGKTVVFTWNEDSESFDAAFAEGTEGDEDLLAELDEDMDLRRLLPAGPVSEGDSWSIEPDAFASILDPGGDLALEDEESEEQDTSDQDAALRENVAGTIRATYRAREEDGVAVIALEVDTNSHAEHELGADEVPEGASGTGRVEVSFLLEGELRWDLGHGHALSFELSGESGLTAIQTITGEFEGESIEHVQTMVFSGETSFSMHVERR